MANETTFIGFSSSRGLGNLYDIDLVNQDLLNEINTRKGTKVMDPEFGCIVHDLLFEVKSPGLVADIQDDITRIINRDPRVELQTLDIYEIPYGYAGVAVLKYNQFATIGELNMRFNQDNNA